MVEIMGGAHRPPRRRGGGDPRPRPRTAPRNYGRRSSPSPPPRRRRSPSRSPDRSKIERRRMEDRSRDREEEEVEPRQQRYPRERPIFSVYRPVYRGYSTTRPDDDFDLRQSDSVDREWRRQYKKHRATVA